jgi:hypothetical protein
MRRRDLVAWGLLAASLSAARGEQAARAPIEWARLLLKQVPPQSTSYEHGPGRVHWQGDAEPVESHTDCSGLVNAVLARSFGWSPQVFQRRFGRKRPVASTYFDAIEARRGFDRIERIQDVREGDFIAIRYPDGSPDSGHIMIVDAPAVPDMRSGAAAARMWAVRVIDSSRSGHGPADTRATGPHRFREGIGSGELRIGTGVDGAVQGYAWSTIARSTFYRAAERPVAIGRLLASG